MDQHPTHPSDRGGLTATLLAHYPAAYRLAVGLCGEGDAAAAVVHRVLHRAVVAARRWASDEQANRWFTRYTVLMAREIGSPRGGGTAGSEGGPLAWLGPLPRQQREAVVLQHGLGLDLHRMAAAMDCSSRAASNHLVAAVATLRSVEPAGVPMGDAMAGLPDNLAAVVPPAVVLAIEVDRAVRRRWRRLWIGRAIVLACVTVAAWAAWRLWGMLVF